ncbi:hypothetical protein PYL83_05570 [Moraxella lacunata]|uniref:hypothetical protein n=1 Tax=Moraxella lacunata TaxID=477 RepID=UPI00247FA595|nr:hypothetical protein [Moraxella lacunata]MDH9218708.1 hypothetical protein [Moraxella lacunata]
MKSSIKSLALALALTLPFASGVAHAKTPAQPAKTAVQSKSVITHIRTQDGLKLHLQKDIPHAKPKAIVVISHGLASHSACLAILPKR